MPDVMTPESMVTKLDTFENLKDGDEEPTKDVLDVRQQIVLHSVAVLYGRAQQRVRYKFTYDGFKVLSNRRPMFFGSLYTLL